MSKIEEVTNAMIAYNKSDVLRINHFLKVYGFAKTIGALEGLDKNTQYILEVAALTHDIGIKLSEIKYHSSAGNYQQIEGPGEARILLEKLEIQEQVIERVCFLIGHHHTYTNIIGDDYQILVEADFLVNIYEDKMDRETILKIRNQIFKTESGKKILKEMYL